MTGAVAAVALALTGGFLVEAAGGVNTAKRVKGKNPTRAELFRSAAANAEKLSTLNPEHAPLGVPMKSEAAEGTPSVIYGCVVNGVGLPDYGIFSIQSDMGDINTIAIGSAFESLGNGTLAGDKYILYKDFLANDHANYAIFDAKTWRELDANENGPANINATCVTWDPTEQKVYGCFYKGGSSNKFELGVLDINTMTRTTIASINKYMVMACSPEGQLYVIDASGNLFKLDKKTGKATKVGATGVKPHILGINGACFDFKRNVMYYIAASGVLSNYIYKVDTTTGAATAVRTIPGGYVFTGIWVGEDSAAPTAPNKVSDLEPVFNNGALSGNVLFKLPTVTYQGQPGSGNLGYVVTSNGETVIDVAPSMSNIWGGSVTVPVTLAKEGYYTIRVAAKNATGTGPFSEYYGWLGNDYPKPVENIVLEYSQADKQYKLSWDKVTKPLHGGYLSPADVTYNVYTPDGRLVASNLTDNKYVEPSNTLVARTYQVTAVHAGLECEKRLSNTLGITEPPFFESFDVEENFAAWTTIDANNDGVTWEYPEAMRVKGYAMLGRARDNGTKDDWLITPPLNMKTGMEYDLVIKAMATSGNQTEKLEVKRGSAPNIESMNVDVIPVSRVYADSVTWRLPVRVESDGAWYFGIHGMSDPGAGYLELLEFSLEAPMALKAPGAGVFTVTPDYDCALKAKLSYKCPTVDIEGNALESMTKVEFYRDGKLVKTETNVSPGSTAEYMDEINVTLGDHEWRVIPYNEYGVGKNLLVTDYVGVHLPGAVTNAVLTERDNSGVLDVSWNAPEADIYGKPLDPSMVRYDIYDKNNRRIGVAATNRFTISLSDPTMQQFVSFAIVPVTDAGDNLSGRAWTQSIAAGAPYTLPFHESCPSQYVENNWTRDGLDMHYMYETIWASGTPQADAQDNDCGMWGWVPGSDGNETWLYSGKVQLDDKNPTLAFYYRAVRGAADEIEIVVKDYLLREDYKPIKKFTLGEADKDDWVRMFVPLDEYAGKTIQFGFHSICKNHLLIHLIDNIHIEEAFEDDMAIVKCDHPMRTRAGEPVTVTAMVENSGMTDAEDVRVQLWRDDELVAESIEGKFPMGLRYPVELVDSNIGSDANDSYQYKVKVLADYDDNAANDETEPFTVEVSKIPVPAVSDLTAETSADKVELKWTEPDYSAGCPEYILTEDFEGCTSWELDSAPGWTFFDGDKSTNLGLRWMNFPNSGDPCAFTVMDSDYPLADLPVVHLTAYSGTKFLGCWVASEGPNNDWLISPKLQGKAQTIKFMTRSWSNEDIETIKLYYSTTTNRVSAMKQIGEEIQVPAEWTEMSFDIPEGAKYFAIQCVSNDKIVLYIDDITYDWGGGPLTLKGYNVYREGVRQNAEPLQSPVFAVNDDEETHAWHVTALYDRGESVPSNTVYLKLSEVDDMSASDINVYADGRVIVIEGAKGEVIRVADASGISMRTIDDRSGRTSVRVASSGVYMVTVGNRTWKLAIR